MFVLLLFYFKGIKFQAVEIRTNYETTMIFTFEKLAKAYILYRIKTISLFNFFFENFAD